MVCAKVRLSRFGKRIQFSQQEKLLERRGIKMEQVPEKIKYQLKQKSKELAVPYLAW